MLETLHRRLFPSEIRSLPHRRLVLNSFRALHILCISLLLGGYFFNQPTDTLNSWYLGTVLSGLGLLMIDLYGSFILLFEVRGISVLMKIMLLLSLPLFSSQVQLWLLIGLVIFSSFVAHSTRKIRHRNLLSSVWQQKLGIQHLVESGGATR